MRKKITEKPCCLSCHFHCEIDATPSIKMRNCLEKQYCVWPDSNQYFKEGVISGLLNTHYNFLSRGFIFVDFSRFHIRLFTEACWLEHLKMSGLQLIVISDRKMETLAAYWQKESPLIAAVIYADDSRSVIAKKIENVFTGRRTNEKRRQKISAGEMKVLDLLVSGATIKEIAEIFNCPTKRIYNIKRNIQEKMGGRLLSIITS